MTIDSVYPAPRSIPDELPEPAIKFLKQAEASRSIPDGAAMLACSAVDAMLKEKGLTVGSVPSEKLMRFSNLTQAYLVFRLI
jgi:hypothetical protein